MPDEGPERFSPGGGGDYKMFNGLELCRERPFLSILVHYRDIAGCMF